MPSVSMQEKKHVVRSGALTAARVQRICRWVEKLPNDLPKVARACMIYPADLLYWYALGQTYDCPDPNAAELAWRISEIRGGKAAKRQRQLEKAAKGGTKKKVVTKTSTDGDITEEITEEDVLPKLEAIIRLEEQANESAWELSPHDAVAADLIAAFEASKPTPLLTEGGLETPRQSAPPSDDCNFDTPSHSSPDQPNRPDIAE